MADFEFEPNISEDIYSTMGPDDFPFPPPREDILFRPHSSYSSIVSESESHTVEDNSPDAPPVDILFHLEVRTRENTVNFFQDQPFYGFDFGLSELGQIYSSKDKAVLLIHVRASNDLKRLQMSGNTAANWRNKTVTVDGKLNGKLGDWLGINSPILEIVSSRLIHLIDDHIDYNPIQRNIGPHWYPANSLQDNCFSGILLYFPELRATYQNFLTGLSNEPQKLHESGEHVLENFQDIKKEYELASFHTDQEPRAVDAETANDLFVLLKLLDAQYRVKILPTLKKLQGPLPQIGFPDLWLIYKPGTLIYRRRQNEMEAHVVVSATLKLKAPQSRRQDDSVDRYLVEIWRLVYDGRFIRRRPALIIIERFDHDRDVMSLPLIPATIYDRLDGGRIRRLIQKRGKNYLELIRLGAAHRRFSHPTSTYSGEVIIDPVAYRQYNIKRDRRRVPLPPELQSESSGSDDDDEWKYQRKRGNRDEKVPREPRDSRGFRRYQTYHEIDTKDPKQLESMSTDHLFLLSADVNGFALATKKWMRLEVDGISLDEPYQPASQLKESLVWTRPEDHSILETVSLRTSKRLALQADFVPGKGKGQIFLLHGPSGTGKTLTAECVANDTRRPLICLTPTDIAFFEPEEELQKWFTVAARWGAILLIDEADIFLERRQAGDYGRNSLVTTFLRTMEYYEGVLFLTTNRPGQIDDSFISRITVPIEYPALTPDVRTMIWERFFQKHEASGLVRVSQDARNRLRKDPSDLNGREIRNLFQLATTVATMEASSSSSSSSSMPNGLDSSGNDHNFDATSSKPNKILLEWHHFEPCLMRLNGFKGYLKKLHNDMDERKRNMMMKNYRVE